MALTRLDDAPTREVARGHIRGRWTTAAGTERIGLSRIEVPAGGWSTPAHEHRAEEEMFYVLAGRGLSWLNGGTAEFATGDCIVYLPRTGAHTLYALEPVDVLAFGMREDPEGLGFPRLGMSKVAGRVFGSAPGSLDGVPIQFIREAELGPPDLPAQPGPRPPTMVNLADVEPQRLERPRVVRTRRNLGRAAGSVRTGLQHVEVAPGKESTAQHCHSLEDEIFVVLDGQGVLLLGHEEIAVRAGHVVTRPAGTGVAHVFRAGESGLSYLAYGTREPGDMCFYPRSSKVAFRGLGVIARVQALDYWDGED
jgi:uncharacterized cupin superfamily protein